MGGYIAGEVVKLMIRNNVTVKGAEVLVLGITFKENCPDVRNTRVVDIIAELNSYETNISVYDPWAKAADVAHEYGINLIKEIPADKKFGAVILAVAHKEFLPTDWKNHITDGGIIYDVKGCLSAEMIDARL